jgi:hypothetical protein
MTAIDDIKTNYIASFDDADNEIDGIDEFVDSLQSSYDTYFGIKLSNPNPAPSQSLGVTQISPSYITKYGNYDKTGTTLNSIYNEFDSKLKASIEFRNQAREVAEIINDNAEEIKTKLEEIQTELLKMLKLFDKFNSDTLDSWMDIVRI